MSVMLFLQTPLIWTTISELDCQEKVSLLLTNLGTKWGYCLRSYFAGLYDVGWCDFVVFFFFPSPVTNFIMKAFINGRRVFGTPIKIFPKEYLSKMVSCFLEHYVHAFGCWQTWHLREYGYILLKLFSIKFWQYTKNLYYRVLGFCCLHVKCVSMQNTNQVRASLRRLTYFSCYQNQLTIS